MTVMYRWFEQTGYDADIAAVRQEYPPLATFNRWLEGNWNRASAQRASGR
jgi:hypothetical protein